MPAHARATAVLLLPRDLPGFILRDQAEDLLRAPGVVAVSPGRVPYGAYLRVPPAAADRLAALQARRLSLPGAPRAVVIFHPVQEPLARALRRRHPEAELWYGRWDRYEEAQDASAAQRVRLRALHERALAAATLTFTASDALAELDGAGVVVGLAADSFPAPEPDGTVVALSLGHLGRRVDWALLRGVAERMGDELVLLLVGDVHPDELGDDPDFAACRAMANLVFLGHQGDAAAARLLLCADAGIVPFSRTAFNDAGLPYRILKAARLGRRTVVPPLAGARTWSRATVEADGPDAWVAALRAERGRRTAPHADLRQWALAQTAARVNAPLWARLDELGIDTTRT
jgi:hypothetical protein